MAGLMAVVFLLSFGVPMWLARNPERKGWGFAGWGLLAGLILAFTALMVADGIRGSARPRATVPRQEGEAAGMEELMRKWIGLELERAELSEGLGPQHPNRREVERALERFLEGQPGLRRDETYWRVAREIREELDAEMAELEARGLGEDHPERRRLRRKREALEER